MPCIGRVATCCDAVNSGILLHALLDPPPEKTNATRDELIKRMYTYLLSGLRRVSAAIGCMVTVNLHPSAFLPTAKRNCSCLKLGLQLRSQWWARLPSGVYSWVFTMAKAFGFAEVLANP